MKDVRSYFTEEKYRLLFESARSAYEELSGKDRIVIVSHIDADGLSSSAIAKFTLDRSGINNEIVFLKNI
ncbi:MAG: single-stranded DNA exonuclease RecJ, partial [Thermoplasmata archaeon]